MGFVLTRSVVCFTTRRSISSMLKISKRFYLRILGFPGLTQVIVKCDSTSQGVLMKTLRAVTEHYMASFYTAVVVVVLTAQYRKKRVLVTGISSITGLVVQFGAFAEVNR